MGWNLSRKAGETVDVSHLLTGVTGTAWLTRSGKIRVLRLIDIVPTTLTSGGMLLQLPAEDRPPYRLDDRWPTIPSSTSTRAGFVLPQGPVGVWSPATTDQYRLTITWGVA